MLVGQILQQRYHLIAQISNSKCCQTYLALDKSPAKSDKKLKYIIKHFPLPDHHLEKRLQIAAQLQGINGISDRVPQLLQYWLQQDQFFLAYEYIDNHCLATELSHHKIWPEKLVISLLAEIMEILQPLHQQKIGHGNLHLRQLGRRVNDQQLILTDTGLVKLTHPQPLRSENTPDLQDPHLIQQDLQMLGKIAIQLLTGIETKQLINTPEKLAWRQPNTCGQDLAAVIDRLVSNDPSQNWSSVLPAWVKLSQIMNQVLNQQQNYTTNPMIDLNSHDSSELKRQADHKFLQGDAAGAIIDYGELIQLDPQPLHYHNRGIIYAHELGDYQNAIQDYNQTLLLKPDFAMAHHNRANAQRSLGNLLAAIADYNYCVKLLPNLAIIYWERGLTHQRLGNLTAAIEDYTKFLEYQPYHDSAYYQRGNVYQQLGNNIAAEADYDQAIQVNPQSAKAHYNRGTFHYQQAHLPAALADYSQAIKLDPQMTIAYQQRGWIYQQQRELDLALVDYQQTINLSPSADIYHQVGAIYSELGNIETALLNYNQAIALDPSLVKTYNNRGIIKRHQKDLLGAISDYSQGLSLDPKSLDCLRNRGIARQELQDYAGAIADYRRAANLHLSHGQQSEYEKILTIINKLQKYY